MNLGFGNNVKSALAADITATQTVISVMPGTGNLFAALLQPDPALENHSHPSKLYAKVTLTDAQETVFEICHLTAVSADKLTVIRGQEGTAAKGWSLNNTIANFATRGSEDNFVQIEDLQNGRYLAATAGGTANALTVDLPSTFYLNGGNTFALHAPLLITPTLTNTGASTLMLTLSGHVVGTYPLVKGNNTALQAGDLVAKSPFMAIFNTEQNRFLVMNPTTEIGVVRSVNTHKPDASGDVKLGTAADADVGKDLPGQVLQVGSYGLSNTLTALDSTDLNTLQTFGFYVVRNSVNGPVGSNPGTVFLKVITWQSGNGASGYRVIQEVIGYGASASTGNRVWRRTWTGTIWTGWVEFYSETYKPTAVDIAALPLIGGKMTGEIQSTSANALRMIQGGYGVILRMDANGFYILQTNKNDPNGNYNDKRSLTISNDTGAVGIGTQLTVTNADFINKVGYTTYKDGDGHDHYQVGGLRLEVDGSQMAELYYNVLAGQSAEVSLHNKYGTTDSYLSLRNNGVLSLVGSAPQLYLGGSRVGSDGNVFGAAYGNDWLTNWVKSYTFNGNNHPTQSSVSGNQWWYKDLSTGMIFQGGYTEGQSADARDRIALNISVPNRLLYVSTIIKNYAQGYDTTYNPQVGDLAGERDGFWWFHGAQERVIYWMAVGY